MSRAYIRRKNAGIDTGFCLAILDVDSFKLVNDTYGHIVGDAVIRHVADLITANIRASDYAFRYGGDEFSIIFTDLTLEESRAFCQKICQIISNYPYTSDDLTIPLTLSIGIEAYDPEKNIRKLVHEADQKLYESKRKGRNQVT